MKKIGLVLMAVMLMLLQVPMASAEENHDTIEEKAHKLASVIVSDYGVSSIQYAILDHGSITLSNSAGIADKETKAPVNKDTMFGVGSVSKMYVSAATMMLVDAGKVDIDQPLTTYIKDFTMADERYKQITPRMLLNHSSGLYGAHYKNSMLFNDNDTQNHDQLLVNLRSERLKSNPGEYSVYSNDGFQLLEILVERVSGLTYSEFIATHISKPLDLNFTKTPLDQFDRQHLAKTYFPGIDAPLAVENTNVIGTGGVYATAEELVKFSEILTGHRPDILSEQSAAAMQSHEYRKGVWVPEERNIFNYGLGWDSVQLAPFSDYGITALSKGGDTVLYHSALISIPEHHLSIAVVSSGGSSFYNSIFASTVLQDVLKEKGIIKDITPEKTPKSPVKADMPADLSAYSGLYGNVGATTQVDIQNGEFELPALLDGIIPAQKYVYTGSGHFTSSDGTAEVSFEQQTNGKTYIKVNALLDFPGLGQTEMVYYEYQKLNANPVKDSVKKAWEARDGKKYYAVDEKMTSVFYLVPPAFLIKNIAVDTGYANGTEIVDENYAVNAIEIPIMSGRDAFDLNFYKKENSEYLKAGEQHFIREDAIKPLHTAKTTQYKIPSNGYAQWFKIDESTANKNMVVDFPKSGGFAVYDENGSVVHFSTVNSERSIVLPKGGLIVFGGNAGDVFKVKLKNQ
ncbi:beta-lactamase family protein [Paenibacillus sp. P96]|uniref:Beta-lactamase family protein n=1 Tax=Paenibacillus zeirhizosphaerae TaxID=2987519 RepID=A0ABT9FVW4_9BACL|nr:serine hydrolase domain-containing protein [Paenibacillus sp. P96]MDP4098858.1 beta-lactamase family protein [Paenibacillus sp. P96]